MGQGHVSSLWFFAFLRKKDNKRVHARSNRTSYLGDSLGELVTFVLSAHLLG